MRCVYFSFALRVDNEESEEDPTDSEYEEESNPGSEGKLYPLLGHIDPIIYATHL